MQGKQFTANYENHQCQNFLRPVFTGDLKSICSGQMMKKSNWNFFK